MPFIIIFGTLSFPMSKLLFTQTGLGYASLNEPDTLSRCNHRRRKGSVIGGHHGECGARAYNGGLGQSPQRGPGTQPLIRGSGGRSPPEAESLLAFQRPITAKKITSITVSSKLRVCDVSSTFNRIPNISLLKTGGFKVAEVDGPSARL